MSTSPDTDTAMNGVEDADESLTVEVETSAPAGTAAEAPHPPNNADVPKPKRLACMICRKRKLRCDGNRPRCSTCTRLGHDCAYDEVRRKSGPKRGYVKALEERLKQVETLLKTQDPPAAPKPAVHVAAPPAVNPDPKLNDSLSTPNNLTVNDPSISLAAGGDMDQWNFNGDHSPQPPQPADTFDFNAIPMQNSFTWEMIGLGLEEPLPPQDSIDEFHQIYFEKVHPSMPMIHKYRYLAAMNLAPNQRPPVCLRYAIWTLACSVADKFADLRDLFYQRARKYVEADYVKGFGEHLISVAHAQTHVLLAEYEFKMMYFPRAWMSTGSAVRLCQMMGLHRLDGAGLDVKQCIPPPRDWTEREERRRTFWMAFTEDRYASIGTGWPMTIDEKDIMSNMPASDDAYDMSRPEQTQTLADSMTPAGAGSISTMGGVVLMACLFGRNLLHLHRPDVDDRDHDLNGEFWKRHRNLDNILLNTSLCLPAHLKLPTGLTNPNVIFTNMCIHTSTICLHQAAIFKADKNRLPASVSAESKVRCITAANEIASTMRTISHIDLSTVNPFTSFCLYVAARVFVQYLKSRPDDSQTVDSLRFLLAAMGALKRRNPLTESFLVQLDVDLEALGARIPKLRAAFPRSTLGQDGGYCWTGKTPPGAKCDEGVDNHGIFAQSDCHFMKTSDNSGDPVSGPSIVDTDPSRPSNQANPSSMSGTNSRWSNTGPVGYLERLRSGNGPTFGSGMLRSFGNEASSGDMSASPDAGLGSDRPTPNSSTSASDRHNGSSNGFTANSNRSGRNSFEASPASSTNINNNGNNNSRPTQDQLQSGNIDAFFQNLPGSDFATGLTPNQQFTMPDTPGKTPGGGAAGSNTGDFNWEQFTSGTTGMTPVSEGVLRTMLQMGPMETMDMGWDAQP
ncbi:fungal-specific transcription factor domain-containing protein [Diaporthe sp. PMI_573]|nr:fungal-specific transcription factor domain-containing protein [Diaporthaceae sp. PMI_573]